jgi:Rieske Fe-S protein
MEITRRNFLCGSLLTALGATSASVTSAHAAAGVKKISDGSVEVIVASIKSLAKVGGIALIGEVNGVPAALVRTGAKKYAALDLRCTHAGIVVKPKAGGFYCEPAQGGHGSAFSRAGAVSQGPADAALNKLSVTVKGKKVVVS